MKFITNIVGRFRRFLEKDTFKLGILFFVVFVGSFSMVRVLNVADLFGSGTSDPVFEGEGLQGGAHLVQEKIEGSDLGIAEEGSLMDTILFVIKYLLIFAGVIALFAFLYAGFRYITSFGSDVDGAKEAMINAAIGILIILFSWVIINFLITFNL